MKPHRKIIRNVPAGRYGGGTRDFPGDPYYGERSGEITKANQERIDKIYDEIYNSRPEPVYTPPRKRSPFDTRCPCCGEYVPHSETKYSHLITEMSGLKMNKCYWLCGTLKGKYPKAEFDYCSDCKYHFYDDTGHYCFVTYEPYSSKGDKKECKNGDLYKKFQIFEDIE